GGTGVDGWGFELVGWRAGLRERCWRLLASERSSGKEVSWCGQTRRIKSLRPDSFDGIDVAFFSAGASVSREFAPHATRAGARVIDNSSAFRMDAGVPLIVPEVNGDALQPEHKVIPNPNCSTIILV